MRSVPRIMPPPGPAGPSRPTICLRSVCTAVNFPFYDDVVGCPGCYLVFPGQRRDVPVKAVLHQHTHYMMRNGVVSGRNYDRECLHDVGIPSE